MPTDQEERASSRGPLALEQALDLGALLLVGRHRHLLGVVAARWPRPLDLAQRSAPLASWRAWRRRGRRRGRRPRRPSSDPAAVRRRVGHRLAGTLRDRGAEPCSAPGRISAKSSPPMRASRSVARSMLRSCSATRWSPSSPKPRPCASLIEPKPSRSITTRLTAACSRCARFSSIPSDSWNCWLFVTPVSGSLAAAAASRSPLLGHLREQRVEVVCGLAQLGGPFSSARAAGVAAGHAPHASAKRPSGAATTRSIPATSSDTSRSTTPAPMPSPIKCALRVALATGVVETTMLSRPPPRSG